ncbi:MAG: sulfate adenylyltransferase [Candidatus Hecatellales archaeon]|nr:MAG: sulfate adenylyltransferase [Candidatus Hecatellales archaeon]
MLKNKEKKLDEAKEMPKILVDSDTAVDLENLAYGVYSPLEGFMLGEEFFSVLDNMRLPNDLPWTLPIVFSVDEKKVSLFKEGDEVALFYPADNPIGFLRVEEVYRYSKEEYALKVFKTKSLEHPGVAKVYGLGDFLVGGKIWLVGETPNPYKQYTLYPAETRILFREKGWRTIAGFQTRNVPHVGHEYVQKTALAFVDGIFINPVIGRKKKGDFTDDLILEAYNTLIKNYYKKDTVVMSILRYEMRYAGPREAIHHAIIRKNFGCTHFIVGRDHAGVGNYYKPYEAQEIFKDFPDLGIVPLFFREFFYCKKCGGIVNEKTCPHSEEFRFRFSGTLIRGKILKGEKPLPEIMRPEISELILSRKNPFVG